MIDKALEAKILRYHFVEQWGVNTIARQLGIHHSAVDRVLSQAGLPKAERARRPSIVDPYHPLIIETLAQYPTLSAARLLGMAQTIESVTGELPQALLADAGYKSETNSQALEEARIDGYISQGREGKRPPQLPGSNRPACQRMEQKLNTPAGRSLYRRRKGIAEPVVGWIKNILGFRQFSFRGDHKVAAEWDLVCLAVNLKRMNRLIRWI